MQKNSKRTNNSRAPALELNSVDAEKERNKSQNNFVELLPLEVTFKIFSELDIRSLCRASVTCKSWNYAIRNSDSLWKPHCLTVRTVCQREIDGDLERGYSWRVSLICAVCSVYEMLWEQISAGSHFCLEKVGLYVPNSAQSVLTWKWVKVELLFFSCQPLCLHLSFYILSILLHFLDPEFSIFFPVNQESSYFFSLHIIQNFQ